MRKLVLRNGKIYVERGRFAQALYAEDGVIQAVGTEEEVLTAAGKRDGSGNGLDGAEIIDLEGRTVIPGINDSHMHLLNVGMDFATAPITGVSSVDEMVERVKEFVRRKGLEPGPVYWGKEDAGPFCSGPDLHRGASGAPADLRPCGGCQQ